MKTLGDAGGTQGTRGRVLSRSKSFLVSGSGTSAVIMTLRAVTMVSRFVLSLFIARELGLAALGEFGLISAAVALGTDCA